jgi:AcrR family transcriptional regulator
VSKATLYSRFPNKDEIFRAVCERMAQLQRRAFANALAAPDRTVDDRVVAAVVGKHRLTFDLVRTSPHAEDLFSHKAQLAGELFAHAEEAMVRDLATALGEDAVLRPSAPRLARALFFGSGELAARCATAAELDAEVTAFVTVHLAGARATAAKTPRRR